VVQNKLLFFFLIIIFFISDLEAAVYTDFGFALKKVASTWELVYSCFWSSYITNKNGGN
jgi:hypothetical protein